MYVRNCNSTCTWYSIDRYLDEKIPPIILSRNYPKLGSCILTCSFSQDLAKINALYRSDFSPFQNSMGTFAWNETNYQQIENAYIIFVFVVTPLLYITSEVKILPMKSLSNVGSKFISGLHIIFTIRCT